jgi:hypothetical protein
LRSSSARIEASVSVSPAAQVPAALVVDLAEFSHHLLAFV